MTKLDLSIVILNYNTRELTLDCLRSLEKVYQELEFEVIVVDNGSTDGSVKAFKKIIIKNQEFRIKLLELKKNLGFAGGNNAAKKYAKGKYVLILNSDTLIHQSTLKRSYKYMESHEDAAMLTCKMILPDGLLDQDARRSFPTPWISLTHLILRLDRIFPKSKIFAKYWYGYIDPDKTHEIDVAQGAYMFTRKSVLDDVGWFDEDYFLDGEDIDLCWKIKQKGWKIVYYPKVSITHVKKASKKKPSKENRRKFVTSGMDSMELFYRKRWWDRYPRVLNYTVILGIKIVKKIRMLSYWGSPN